MANIILPIQIEASWLTDSYIERQVTQLITHYEAAHWGSIDKHFYDSVRVNEDGFQPDTYNLVNLSGPWGSSYTELAQKDNGTFIFSSFLRAGWWQSAMVTYNAVCTFKKRIQTPVIQRVTKYINFDSSRNNWFLIGHIDSLYSFKNYLQLPGAKLYNYATTYSATIANPYAQVKLSRSTSNPDDGPGLYIWVKFEESKAPIISNISPPAGASELTLRPTISASFEEGPSEAGVNINTFKLMLKGGLHLDDTIVPGAPGLTINANGFSYTPPFNFPSKLISLMIELEDAQRNKAMAMSSFNIDLNTAPIINNISPMDGSVLLQDGQPEIRADFVDRGAGVEIANFSLALQGPNDNYFVAHTTKPAQGLIRIDTNGFIFRVPQVISEAGKFKYEIRITDRDGNQSTQSGSFTADYLPLNPKLEGLSVIILEKVGATQATRLANMGITTLGQLAMASPFTVSSTSGLGLLTVKDIIKRARMVCSEVRFSNEDFGELLTLDLDTIVKMTDSQMMSYDVAPEALGELLSLKGSIDTMLIALDDAELKKIKLQDLIW